MRNAIILLAAAALMAIGACNTVEGVGKDVTAAGTVVTGAAQDAK